MKRRSNQRITKIKIDKINELLKEAEKKNVEDACVVQPQGSDLTPYPDLERLRIWTHNYLLSGITKVFANVSSDNADDTYTVLIDGFPIFTSLLKTTNEIEVPAGKLLNPILNKTGSPSITEDFIYTPSSFSDYISFSNSNIKPGTEIVLKVTFNSPVSNNKYQFITGCADPFALQVSPTGNIVNFWTTGQQDIVTANPDTPYYFKCVINSITNGALQGSWCYSTDGTSYSTPITGETSGSLDTTLQFTIGVHSIAYENRSWLNGIIDLKESYLIVDGVKQNFVIDGATTKTVKTTKPGLWLSNLLTPISESQAGSWLCHNLINNNEQNYNSINADTFGNYCYSFIQRGLFYAKSEFGSYPESCTPPAAGVYGRSDLFNLQWLPGDKSCTSYRALQGSNATGKFGNIYTTYSTIITPIDPDQQIYSEGNSKCLELSHINAPLEENLHTEIYTSRLVGKDWTYELTFTPNGNGSGNNYGDGTGPGADAPNGSNGGCVTGTITSTIINSDGDETTCSQEINQCFQTIQSKFNPDAPNHSDNDIGEENSNASYNFVKLTCNRPRSYFPLSWEFNKKYNISISRDNFVDQLLEASGYSCGTDGNHNAYIEYYSNGKSVHTTSLSGVYLDTYDSLYELSGTYTFINSAGVTETSDIVLDFENNTGWCNSCAGSFTVSAILQDDLQPETGVNIYLNITDLKAEAEANGLPWDNTQCSTRFSIEVSTIKCKSPYCTSRLIASNVDISKLGDISQLTSKVFN